MRNIVINGIIIISILLGAIVVFRGLSDPANFLADFGMIADNPSARNEMRASYAGIQIVSIIFLLLALFNKVRKSLALGIAFAHIGGVLLGRIISLVVEGPGIFSEYIPLVKTLYGVDTFVTIITGLAFFWSLEQEKGKRLK